MDNLPTFPSKNSQGGEGLKVFPPPYPSLPESRFNADLMLLSFHPEFVAGLGVAVLADEGQVPARAEDLLKQQSQ